MSLRTSRRRRAAFLQRDIGKADLDVYFEIFDEAFAETKAFPGIVAMLDDIVSLGIPVGIVTTATRRAANSMLRVAGIASHFDVLVAGDDGTQPKPHPDALLRLIETLDVEPSDAAYVGDDDVDLQCAEAAHALPVLAGWARNEPRQCRTPHLTVDHPADIADRLKLIGGDATRQGDCP